MTARRPITPMDLVFPPFALWERQWLLLTAGELRPGGYNSMTVSWGGLGVLWGRPLAMVVVRPQRYTFEFMERASTFSLCAFPAQYHDTLNMLGTLSGRDSDKMARSGLTPIALSQIACPGFAEADLVLECRKSYYHDLDPSHFLADYIAGNYRGDFHRVYFGEVVAAQGIDAYRAAGAPQPPG